MKGKWLFAVIAILLTVLLMGISCGCGSDEGREIPPPGPNDGGTEVMPPAPNEGVLQSEAGNCGACSQAGYEPMQVGSFLGIGGTIYDLTCASIDIQELGVSEAVVTATIITSTCDQATLRLNVEATLFDTKKVFVDNSKLDNYLVFLEARYKITGTGEGLSVGNILNPTEILGAVNSDGGPISLNLDL